MNLPPPRQFHTMQPIESRQKGMWILLNILVIFLQYTPQELMFGMSDRLDDEAIISRKVEERTRFTRRTQFG